MGMCTGEQCGRRHHDLRCDGARGCERDALPRHKLSELLAHKPEHRAVRKVEQGATTRENHQWATCQKSVEGCAMLTMAFRACYEPACQIGVNGALRDREYRS